MLACHSAFKRPVDGPPSNLKTSSFKGVFTLHMDADFSASDSDIVYAGFSLLETVTNVVRFVRVDNSWTAKSNMKMTTESGCTRDVYVYSLTSGSDMVKSIDKTLPSDKLTVGFAESTCRKRVVGFVMDRIKSSTMLYRVSLHEAGHVVGMWHIELPKRTIMHPMVDESAGCFTLADASQFCKIWDCDASKVRVCDFHR